MQEKEEAATLRECDANLMSHHVAMHDATVTWRAGVWKNNGALGRVGKTMGPVFEVLHVLLRAHRDKYGHVYGNPCGSKSCPLQTYAVVAAEEALEEAHELL